MNKPASRLHNIVFSSLKPKIALTLASNMVPSSPSLRLSAGALENGMSAARSEPCETDEIVVAENDVLTPQTLHAFDHRIMIFLLG